MSEYKCKLCESVFKTKFALDYHMTRPDHSATIARPPRPTNNRVRIVSASDSNAISSKTLQKGREPENQIKSAINQEVDTINAEEPPPVLPTLRMMWVPKTERETLLKGLRDQLCLELGTEISDQPYEMNFMIPTVGDSETIRVTRCHFG